MSALYVTARQFISIYIEILESIDGLIDPKLYPAIRRLYCTDPRDLISPEGCFVNREHAVGFVWSLLAKTYAAMQKESVNAIA